MSKLLITGSSGYIASMLIPKLTSLGHTVYGMDIDQDGDIRNEALVRFAVKDIDAVVHLACISNDPAFDLNPNLGKSINFDAFRPLVRAAKDAGVKRFIYASSSSVYGFKKEQEVTENLTLEPLTDYSKYKAMCEEVLLEERTRGFETVIARPATICGWSPTMRFDLSVHILTLAAIRKRKITVYGGEQRRPHIYIGDMIDAYVAMLDAPKEKVDGEIFNVGRLNLSMLDLADIIRGKLGGEIELDIQPLHDDKRSYSISSQKIFSRLGFRASTPISEAIQEVHDCLKDGRVENPDDEKFYTIKRMKRFA